MPSDRALSVEIRYFADCPNWMDTRDAVERVLGRAPRLRRVETPEEAEELDFPGSPTVLVEGVDPWADQTSFVGLACRVYRTPEGRIVGGPTEEMLREALS